MSENIYKRAAMQDLRFSGGKGQFTPVDLFQLSLADLDRMAKATKKALDDEGEQSFLASATVSKASTENRLRLDILIDVIQTKEAQKAASLARAEKADQKARLQELIANKRNEAMSQQSIEDLEKQLAALEV